jgi:hypothetical protein
LDEGSRAPWMRARELLGHPQDLYPPCLVLPEESPAGVPGMPHAMHLLSLGYWTSAVGPNCQFLTGNLIERRLTGSSFPFPPSRQTLAVLSQRYAQVTWGMPQRPPWVHLLAHPHTSAKRQKSLASLASEGSRQQGREPSATNPAPPPEGGTTRGVLGRSSSHGVEGGLRSSTALFAASSPPVSACANPQRARQVLLARARDLTRTPEMA